MSRVEYTGNGSTVLFPVTFGFFEDDDLVVIKILISTGAQAVQTLGVDYTVAGAGGGSGTVTMGAAPSSLYTLRIERTIPIVQLQALSTQGPLTAAALEEAYRSSTGASLTSRRAATSARRSPAPASWWVERPGT